MDEDESPYKCPEKLHLTYTSLQKSIYMYIERNLKPHFLTISQFTEILKGYLQTLVLKYIGNLEFIVPILHIG